MKTFSVWGATAGVANTIIEGCEQPKLSPWLHYTINAKSLAEAKKQFKKNQGTRE